MRTLVTGVTGFVGGHLAEACVARGLSVRALARPASDTALLDRLGAEVCQFLARQTDGVYQADGQGFFAPDGSLLLQEY